MAQNTIRYNETAEGFEVVVNGEVVSICQTHYEAREYLDSVITYEDDCRKAATAYTSFRSKGA
jgi:hypothetical protein